MVHGYHVVFVTYGAWLPNDPRGSWSEFIAAWELFYFGKSSKGVPAGFQNSLDKYGITIWACSILSEHIHLVLARTGKSCEVMTNFLKGEATRELSRQRLHPLAAHSESGRAPQPWARKHWQVFLDDTPAIDSAIKYVDDNPENEGRPRQQWAFVSPFRGVDSDIVSYPD